MLNSMRDEIDFFSKTRDGAQRGRRRRDRAGWRDKRAIARWLNTRPSASVPLAAQSLARAFTISHLDFISTLHLEVERRMATPGS